MIHKKDMVIINGRVHSVTVNGKTLYPCRKLHLGSTVYHLNLSDKLLVSTFLSGYSSGYYGLRPKNKLVSYVLKSECDYIDL